MTGYHFPPAGLPSDWPHREHSRLVSVGKMQWHVQIDGRGPVVVLLHGTGASAHSFADVVTRLGSGVTVIVPDLPGHGFTSGAAPADLTLPLMARALDELLGALDVPEVSLVVGHSAGAALALRWQLMTSRLAGEVVGLNPALIAPPQAYSSYIGPVIAPIASSGLTASLLVALGQHTRLIDHLIDGTGSKLTALQRRRYSILFERPSHVQGALSFMAAADLPALLDECRARDPKATFVVGGEDRWLPKARLLKVIAENFPRSSVISVKAGHLFHEEDAARAAEIILSALRGANEPAARFSNPAPS
ncbi:MAG: alpha/beta fold hydrolase BchO [Burkholderiaceae bacterium]|jgi:magnesium chelatase accessory protein